MNENNKMRSIEIEKVTINIGLGSGGERLERIKQYVEALFKTKFVKTLARTRNPTFKIKKGDVIGLKATFRGKKAIEVLKNCLMANKNKLKGESFNSLGHFSFGVKEYIEYPNAKYDPSIGLFGFDVCVTFKRKGYRIAKRRIKNARIGKKHLTNREDAIEFMKKNFNITIA